MTTKDKILDAALQLFNHEGAVASSTNHVASAAGLSPGNLYYHYKNKEDIVRALFTRLDHELNALFKLPEDRALQIADLEHLLHGNFALLWRYRFFYRDQLALLRRDPELRALYRTVRERGFHGTRALIAAFAESGVLRPLTDTQLEALARVAYLISDFWLPSLELNDEPATETEFGTAIDTLRVVLEPFLANP
jgi:AcrR family transcriptional regulator